MSQSYNTPEENKAALAEMARRCFFISFDGIIAIYCVDEARTTDFLTDASRNISSTPVPDLFVDGYQSPPVILHGNEADFTAFQSNGKSYCEWRASLQSLTRIFENKRHLVSAFISGRLTIAGDLAVMIRLQPHKTISQ